jgi:class 3 adenylate cyclase
MLARHGLDPHGLGVGIGIHTGLTAFGEFGTMHKDVTAVGNVVNLAARLQSAAGAGEILVSREVAEKIRGVGGAANHGARAYTLKGFAQPVTAYLM